MYNDNDNTSGEEDGPATFFCYEKAAELYDDALRELDDIKQRMSSEYELPPLDLIG